VTYLTTCLPIKFLFIDFLIQFQCVFGRFWVRGVQKHQIICTKGPCREKNTKQLTKTSLSAFPRFFFAFWGVSQRGEFKTTQAARVENFESNRQ
jgi:hypothetical protein